MERSSSSSMVVALGVSVLWLVVSGAAGIGWQQGDWLKHNVILADLIRLPWPVLYTRTQPLVYYLAYYLLPALAGKIGGWHAAYAVLGLQTWLMYFLAALWVGKVLGRHGQAGLAAFCVFSGLDAIGGWVTTRSYDPSWSGLQYSHPALLVMFVPQHVIIGWLGAALVLESDRIARPELAVLTWLVSPCWSPFVTLGLAPFVLFTWLRHRGWRHALPVQVAVALTVFVPAVLFFEARPSLPRMTWLDMDMPWPTFILFMFLEWALFAGLLWLVEGRELFRRPFVLLAMLSLAVIPFVPFRGYTDFVMRCSIPALFFLAVQVIRSAFDGLDRFNPRVAALWGALVLGALEPLALYRRSFAHFEFNIPPLEALPSLPQLPAFTGRPSDGKQYIGHIDTPFFEHLAARRTT